MAYVLIFDDKAKEDIARLKKSGDKGLIKK